MEGQSEVSKQSAITLSQQSLSAVRVRACEGEREREREYGGSAVVSHTSLRYSCREQEWCVILILCEL